MRAPLRAAAGLVLTLLAPGATPSARGQSPLPPAPARYLNDYAGVVMAEQAARIEQTLRRFDEETTSQVVVAVFPRLPSPSLEDFTVRTAQAWRVGRGKLDNGAVLFVFVQDRLVRIETGYGLEGALPDALARRIIEEQIVPRFRAGDYGGGIEQGVEALMAATRGEYTASPAPARAAGRRGGSGLDTLFLLLLLALIVGSIGLGGGRRSRTYGRRGYRGGPWWWGGGFGGGGFGGRGGGGWGGGGFSGGGGSFGGGGASGRW